MPFYEIQHSTPLTVSQRDHLADGITTLHATTFTTPRLFVNVTFHDTAVVSQYIGGRPRRGRDNHVRVYARTGPGRTREDWEGLCRGVEKLWGEVVGVGAPRTRRAEAQVLEQTGGKGAEGRGEFGVEKRDCAGRAGGGVGGWARVAGGGRRCAVAGAELG
nr:hypothetical protein CFP56_12381 [Quercus suber]